MMVTMRQVRVALGFAVVALLLAPGCDPPGKKKSGVAGGDPSGMKEESKAKKGKKAGTAAAQKPLAALFGQIPGSLPTVVARLSFRMTKAEAAKIYPAFATRYGKLKPKGFPGVEITLGYARPVGGKKRIRYVRVILPAEAKTVLEKAWIGRIKHKYSARMTDFWFNPQGGTQALLRERGGGRQELTYYRFASWHWQLGSKPNKLGFESEAKPLLGMTVSDVMTVYKRYHPKKASASRVILSLPGYELQPNTNHVSLTIKNDKVVQVYFKLYHGTARMRAFIEKSIAKKFGKPVKKWLSYRGYGKTPYIKVGYSKVVKAFSFWFTPKPRR